jgi:hypothetical protein
MNAVRTGRLAAAGTVIRAIGDAMIIMGTPIDTRKAMLKRLLKEVRVERDAALDRCVHDRNRIDYNALDRTDQVFTPRLDRLKRLIAEEE